MNPVHIIEGRGVPLERSDVDTDQIIPSDWLKRVERTGFGRGLFSEWRDDTNFVLNHDEYVGASILVTGARFGIGSSREHAVWALLDYGFKAIVASSFGDIFRNNSSKQGLVLVTLSLADVDALNEMIKDEPTRLIVVDVERLRIEVPEANFERSFEMDPLIQERLLHGWDDISLSLLRETAISRYEESSLAPSLDGRF